MRWSVSRADERIAVVSWMEVGHVDDQCRSLPTRPGVSQVVADLRRDVWTPVERDHACVVHHLVRDGHDARRLQDLDVVVVAGREHHRRQPDGDAAIPEAAVGPRVGRAAPLARRRRSRRARACFGRLRRQPSIARIDDEGAAARLRREVLVPVRRPGAHFPAVGHRRDQLPAVRQRVLELLAVEEFLVRHRDGPLERNREVVVAGPDAFEVRITPRRARVRPALAAATAVIADIRTARTAQRCEAYWIVPTRGQPEASVGASDQTPGKNSARGLRGRPRLVVFHLSLALPALIVGPTEPLAAHGRCAGT